MPQPEPGREVSPLKVNDLDWGHLRDEMVSILRSYIQIDTTNPPGNEMKGAQFLEKVLAGEGIPVRVLQSAEGRGNLVARLEAEEGDRRALPLVLMHHMDVVPAEGGAWRFPPFSATLDNGYIWGRGALDDKGLGVMQLLAFILLCRHGMQLQRPLVLLAVADEEQGGGLGAAWMIENHWPLVECEYLWDEGGFGTIGVMSSSPVFAVAVSEKRATKIRLSTSGQAGHGSMPPANGKSANDRLVRALYKLQRQEMPIRLNQVSGEFFRRVARLQNFPASLLLGNLNMPMARSLLKSKLAARPAINAMLRDTIALTRLQSGYVDNVIPEKGEAVLDVRLLPDSDPEKVRRGIQRGRAGGLGRSSGTPRRHRRSLRRSQLATVPHPLHDQPAHSGTQKSPTMGGHHGPHHLPATLPR